MYTKKDFLYGDCTHEEYYSQFTSEGNAKSLVLIFWTEKELKDAYKEDDSLNNLPEKKCEGKEENSCIIFEKLSRYLCCPEFEKFGEEPNLVSKVSVLKQAAREIAKGKRRKLATLHCKM